MDSRWLWAVLLIIIILVGGWYILSHPATTQAPATETPAPSTTTKATMPAASTATPAPVTVTYTDQGFSPKSVTVVEGQTVTWVNNSSKKMWVASGVHPTHMAYDGTSKDAHCATGYAGATPFDECTTIEKGGTYSFTFTKAGDWKYHNHASTADFGDVVVSAASPSEGTGVTASTSVNVH